MPLAPEHVCVSKAIVSCSGHSWCSVCVVRYLLRCGLCDPLWVTKQRELCLLQCRLSRQKHCVNMPLACDPKCKQPIQDTQQETWLLAMKDVLHCRGTAQSTTSFWSMSGSFVFRLEQLPLPGQDCDFGCCDTPDESCHHPVAAV
jgi:hypothetical protein